MHTEVKKMSRSSKLNLNVTGGKSWAWFWRLRASLKGITLSQKQHFAASTMRLIASGSSRQNNIYDPINSNVLLKDYPNIRGHICICCTPVSSHQLRFISTASVPHSEIFFCETFFDSGDLPCPCVPFQHIFSIFNAYRNGMYFN